VLSQNKVTNIGHRLLKKMGSFASSSLWGVGIFPAWELVYIGVGTCVSDVCRFLRSFGDATAGALMGLTFFLVSFFLPKTWPQRILQIEPNGASANPNWCILIFRISF
jgi:hypothetical protein